MSSWQPVSMATKLSLCSQTSLEETSLLRYEEDDFDPIEAKLKPSSLFFFFCPLASRHRISTCTNKRNHDRTQKSKQKTRSNIYLRGDGEGGVVERRRRAEATGHSRGDGNRGVIFELLFCLIQK
ncbi:hypothetical protein SLE2022_401600 [Rubroshorea leprosula]